MLSKCLSLPEMDCNEWNELNGVGANKSGKLKKNPVPKKRSTLAASTPPQHVLSEAGSQSRLPDSHLQLRFPAIAYRITPDTIYTEMRWMWGYLLCRLRPTRNYFNGLKLPRLYRASTPFAVHIGPRTVQVANYGPFRRDRRKLMSLSLCHRPLRGSLLGRNLAHLHLVTKQKWSVLSCRDVSDGFIVTI